MTNASTTLLEALCREVKTVSEEVDPLCSHTVWLGTSNGTSQQSQVHQALENKADAVTSFVTNLNERLDKIGFFLTAKQMRSGRCNDCPSLEGT